MRNRTIVVFDPYVLKLYDEDDDAKENKFCHCKVPNRFHGIFGSNWTFCTLQQGKILENYVELKNFTFLNNVALL